MGKYCFQEQSYLLKGSIELDFTSIRKPCLSNKWSVWNKDLQQQHTVKNKAAKSSAREDRRNFTENKEKEGEEEAKVNDNIKLYDITQSLSGKSQQNPTIRDLNKGILTTNNWRPIDPVGRTLKYNTQQRWLTQSTSSWRQCTRIRHKFRRNN